MDDNEKRLLMLSTRHVIYCKWYNNYLEGKHSNTLARLEMREQWYLGMHSNLVLARTYLNKLDRYRRFHKKKSHELPN